MLPVKRNLGFLWSFQHVCQLHVCDTAQGTEALRQQQICLGINMQASQSRQLAKPSKAQLSILHSTLHDQLSQGSQR